MSANNAPIFVIVTKRKIGLTALAHSWGRRQNVVRYRWRSIGSPEKLTKQDIAMLKYGKKALQKIAVQKKAAQTMTAAHKVDKSTKPGWAERLYFPDAGKNGFTARNTGSRVSPHQFGAVHID